MPRTFIESTDPNDPADQPVDLCRSCWRRDHAGYAGESHPDYDDQPGNYTCDDCEDTLTETDN